MGLFDACLKVVKIVRMFFGSENGENDGQLGMVRVFFGREW